MKILVGLCIALFCFSNPAAAQERNDVGLVIGATVTPSQSLAPSVSLIGPNGNVLPTRDLTFDASLALGAEYDRRMVSWNRTAIYAGIDFLASPNDVQLSQGTQNAPKSYAYIFLTPHVRSSPAEVWRVQQLGSNSLELAFPSSWLNVRVFPEKSRAVRA